MNDKELISYIRLAGRTYERVNDIMFFIKNPDGYYLYVNSAFAEFLGKSASEIQWHTTQEVWGTRETNFMQESDRLVVSGQANKTENNLRLTDKNGNDRFFRVIKFPVFNEAGKIIAVAGEAIDFTLSVNAGSLFIRLMTKKLSPRQKQYLFFRSINMPRDDMAATLQIKAEAIDTHRRRLIDKLELTEIEYDLFLEVYKLLLEDGFL